MNRMNKKTTAGSARSESRIFAVAKTASLTARDPLAYAAALKILG